MQLRVISRISFSKWQLGKENMPYFILATELYSQGIKRKQHFMIINLTSICFSLYKIWFFCVFITLSSWTTNRLSFKALKVHLYFSLTSLTKLASVEVCIFHTSAIKTLVHIYHVHYLGIDLPYLLLTVQGSHSTHAYFMKRGYYHVLFSESPSVSPLSQMPFALLPGGDTSTLLWGIFSLSNSDTLFPMTFTPTALACMCSPE